MALNYRKAFVDLASTLVGSTVPATNELFVESYHKWISKHNPSVTDTPWSAVFVVYVARSVGTPAAITPNFVSVDDLIEWAKSRSLFHARNEEGFTPRAGDIILFNDGVPDHVAIYMGMVANKVDYIEGSIQGKTFMVQRRTRIANSGMIVGYFTPDYDWETSKGLINHTQLSAIMKSIRIQEFRDWLVETYGPEFIDRFVSGTPKGSFTKGWTRVAIAAWKKEMHFSEEFIDGDFSGHGLFSAAIEKPVRVNSRGNRVMLLLGMLYVKGYDPKGWTTRFGANGRAALEAFQKARALPINGVADYCVWEALFK